MWPFKRTYPPKQELPLLDRWSVSRGVHESKPLLVRRRSGMSSVVGHPAYPTRVSVAVPLKAPDANGFPQADEALQLAELEDALAKRLEADREAVYVLAISTNGMREFVFYANDPEEALERLRVVELGNPSHELQFAIEPDPKWTTYKRFA